MSKLAVVSLLSGLALLWGGAMLFLRPALLKKIATAFPRSRIPGLVLTAIDMIWVTFATLDAHIQWVDTHQGLVVMMAPAAFFLVIFFVDELLSVRALGGLFLLVARPMLNAAFMSDTQLRLFVTFLAYVVVVVGMILVWSPYMFRKSVERIYRTVTFARVAAAVGVAYGVLLLVLALTAY